MDKRILRLDERYLHMLAPDVLEWNNKEVTVLSWHECLGASKELYPNDELVGFVEEFSADIPESALEYIKVKRGG